MGVAKWLKGKNGKFLGSIGVGKQAVPASNEVPPVPFILGDPRVTGMPGLDSMYNQYAATRPDLATSFRNALSTVEDSTDRYGIPVSDNINLQVAAAQYAAVDAGQVEVLQEAKNAVTAGDLRLANRLLDAAEEGRKKRDLETAGTDTYTVTKALEHYDKNDYERIEAHMEEFRTAATTPFTVRGYNGEPDTVYPFSAIAAGTALGNVASIIDAGRYQQNDYRLPAQKKDVYSETFMEEARKLASIQYVSPHPEQPQYPHSDYYNFLDKVNGFHRQSHALVRHKIDKLLGIAQTVARNNSPQYKQYLRDLPKWD